VFDPIAAAGTAALITLEQLTDPKRAARLNNQHRVDTSLPSFGEVLSILIDDRWPEAKEPELLSIERAVQLLLVDQLVDLLGNAAAAPQVRADALDALNKIQRRAERARKKSAQSGAHMKFLAKRIQAAIDDPEAYTSDNLTIPPGSPI
jgi:folate-binding Fe-S cluster repair protein YgfZ